MARSWAIAVGASWFAIEPLFALLMVSWPATFTAAFEAIEQLGIDPSLFL